MNNNQPGIPDQLRAKFPDLKAITKPPPLMRINGCGTGVYGKRDFDEETQSYVKTYAICLLFIPIVALGAYRVVDGRGGGWYFIGKESISNFARTWNLVMGCLAAFLALSISWSAHTSSPEYRARQELKRAGELMQSGQPIQAAAVYRQQLDGPAAADARTGLKGALETCLQSEQSKAVAGALHLLAGLPNRADQANALVPDAFNRGLTLVQKFRSSSPAAALEVLNADAEMDPTNSAVAPLKIELLKQIVAASPDDTNSVVELAVAYETNHQLKEACQTLRPYKTRLGATEGARILGQKLLSEQNYADAYGLLFPYVQARLDQMHTIEVSYSNTVASITHRAIVDLNNGQGSEDFYTNYKKATKDHQEEMVDDYVQSRMHSDPSFQRALVTLKEANRIRSARRVRDLGIVQLNRAQELKDAAERKAELEAAEKTFLAIRSFAGESDEYRLFLGQVYYWLGKSQQGKELFDQLLASRNRNAGILIAISRTLRDVGEQTQARSLAEEAYQSAKADKEKHEAAMMRSLLCKDEDDRIVWLQRADQNAPWIQVELNAARGHRALEQGNKTAAADFLGRAINGYDSLPKSSAQLNNCALACFERYEATGHMADQQRGMALIEEAVAMNPGDSILLHNTTYYLISRAVMDVNREAVNFAELGENPDLELLSYFYQNEQGRAQVFDQLHDTEAMKKGLGYLDKVLLLAPKEIAAYHTALELQSDFRDLAALQKLEQHFQIAAPDLAETKRVSLESYAGAKDKEQLEKVQKKIQSLQETARRYVTNGDSLTLQYINTSINDLQQSAWVLGGDVDAGALVQDALAIHQKHPCAASHGTLQSAYFFAANAALASQSPDYAAQARQIRHVLPPQYFIAFLLERGGPLADLAARNEFVIKALAMEKENLANYPSWASINEWAALRRADPEEAADVAKRIKEDDIVRLRDSLQYRFSPWSAPLVVEQYWMQRLLGNEKQATEIYQSAVRDGVPLPALQP